MKEALIWLGFGEIPPQQRPVGAAAWPKRRSPARQGFRRPAEALLRQVRNPVKSRVFKGITLKRVVPFFVFFLLFTADLTSSGAIFPLSLCHFYVAPKPLCHPMSWTLKNYFSRIVCKWDDTTPQRNYMCSNFSCQFSFTRKELHFTATLHISFQQQTTFLSCVTDRTGVH